ncbi:MAG: hypothetical protein ACREBI_11610 [Nitrosotalea sp.]
MQLKNKYYKYFSEIANLVGIPEGELAKKIITLDVGQKFETQNYFIRLKQKTESYGQTLYYICVYDRTGKLIRNDPVFLKQPKREKHPSL